MSESSSDSGESSHADASPSESGDESNNNESNLESKLNSEASDEKSESKNESEEIRNDDGVVAIIYYEDSKGNLEFYLEKNKRDYAIKEERGKLRPIGGGIDPIDKNSSLDALVREIREEVSDKIAQKILINSLMKNKKAYRRLYADIRGRRAYTDVYVIKIIDPNQWSVVKNADLIDDAGLKEILTLHDILSMSEYYFAFGTGAVLKQFIMENYDIKKKNKIEYVHPYHSQPLYAAA